MNEEFRRYFAGTSDDKSEETKDPNVTDSDDLEDADDDLDDVESEDADDDAEDE